VSPDILAGGGSLRPEGAPRARILIVASAALCLALASCSRRAKTPPALRPSGPPRAGGAAAPAAPGTRPDSAAKTAPPAAQAVVQAPAPAPRPEPPPEEEPLELYGMIFDGLKSDSNELRASAVDAAVSLPGEGVTRWLAGRFAGAPAAVRAQIIDVFARKQDRSALDTVLGALKDPDEPVRVAAISALASLGGGKEVPALVRMFSSANQVEKDAAARALVLLRGEGVDGAIAASLKEGAPEARCALLGVLASRQAESEIGAVLAACADPEEPVRVAALDALAALAGPTRLRETLEFILKASTDRERAAAEKAALAVCSRAPERSACEAPVLDALARAKGQARCSVLRLLPRVAGRKALAAVRESIADADQAVQDAAVRALADWPDGSALDAALDLARNSQKESHRVIALRGYVRMLGLGSERSATETLKMYEEGMRAARRPEDKKLVLAALAGVAHPGALKMAESFVKDPALGAEAAMAAIKVAISICGSHRAEAESSLKRIAASAPDERVRNEAARAIEQVGGLAGFILDWWVAGPYTEKGKDGQALFDMVLPPEREGADVVWRRQPLRTELDRLWSIDLHATMRGDNRAGYLKTKIASPKRQDAVLELGSDDGVKVWLNGKLVHSNNALRGETRGEDKVRLTLNQGSNTLMLKVTNNSGDWAVDARLMSPDGGVLDGVRIGSD